MKNYSFYLRKIEFCPKLDRRALKVLGTEDRFTGSLFRALTTNLIACALTMKCQHDWLQYLLIHLFSFLQVNNTYLYDNSMQTDNFYMLASSCEHVDCFSPEIIDCLK